MKKVFIAALMLLSGSALMAQSKIGLKAGVNFAKMTSRSEGISVSSSSRLSYNLTAFKDFPLSETMSFQPGISLNGKGLKLKISDDFLDESFTQEAKADLMYLEVPLNAIAKFAAGNGKFFIGAGPYVAYGLSGKTESSATGFDSNMKMVQETEKNDKAFKKDQGMYKPFDFGVNFLTGYELNSGLSLNAGYGLGLSNIARGSDEKVKNKVFSISVGFAF